MNTYLAGEQMLSEVVAMVYEMVPTVKISEMRNKLSSIMTKYHVKKIEEETIHPDLTEKIDLFLSSKKLEGLSINTINAYRLELSIFSQKVKKHTAEITSADIRVFLSQFPSLKLSSISKKLSVLKSFFSWVTSEEIIHRDPTVKIKPPKKEKRLPKALSIEELEMLREGCQTVRQRALLEVLYATGCRLSEVHDLNKNDINLQNMSTSVVGKGDKEREVYFSFKALFHLKKYLKFRVDNETALILTERKPYRRLSKRGIQREIGIIARNAGLEKKVSPHTLRHTFATLMLNNGADLVAIQHLLGHSDPQTTLIYSSLSDQRKREQYNKFLVQ